MSELWGDPEEYMTPDEAREYSRRLERSRRMEMAWIIAPPILAVISLAVVILLVVFK